VHFEEDKRRQPQSPARIRHAQDGSIDLQRREVQEGQVARAATEWREGIAGINVLAGQRLEKNKGPMKGPE